MEFVVMDNDSGYVSHNQESNFDFSSEDAYKTECGENDLYLSEDALLEKPAFNARQYDSVDSIINSSEESVKTNFSGLEDSDRSEASIVVPEVKSIVWDGTKWKEDNFDNSSLNGADVSKESAIGTPSKSANIKVFANVTNTYDQNVLNQVATRNTFPIDKENVDPSETPTKQYVNKLNSNISPDLFSEDEEDLNILKIKDEPSTNKDMSKEKYIRSKDSKLLKNVQNSLNGVHPPPSVTIVQMNVSEILEKIEANKSLFWKPTNMINTSGRKSFLIDDNTDCLRLGWPEILKARFHGLHYNRSKLSEDFEYLCLKYAERYVGNETQSSCTAFELNPSSSQKRKSSKPRWVAKSPGRRLSHLARRRITFSSSNLQASSSSAILGSRARQILVDARKTNVLKKSPKKNPKRTPSKSPFKIRKNTPSSSAKKKLAMRFREMSGEFESMPSGNIVTFKGALFSHETDSSGMSLKKSTKRALFSSPHKNSPQKKLQSPFSTGLDKKRKRSYTDDNPSKFARSASLDSQIRKTDLKLSRIISDSFNRKPEELSDQHKKKLQWAVYESLRLQNITPTHPQYKIFASVLARVTRKFLPNLRFEGRTTEKMFRIARCHSYAVVKGKTVDEIVNEYMKDGAKNRKPQGYVGLDEFKIVDKEKDKENVVVRNKNSESIERGRELTCSTKTIFSQRIDRIKKVISFEDKEF